MTINDLAKIERPYEKLELFGEKNLSNAELLAIIIKTGTKEESSIEIARKVLNMHDNFEETDLNFLREISLQELTKIKGIGRVKAIQIKAICELANRMNTPRNYKKTTIKEPKDIAKILMNEMQYEKKEIAKIVLLDKKLNIIKIKDIAIGGINFVNIDMREILIEAVKASSPKIILVHNHPTGISEPSKKDVEITIKLEKAASILGIELIDHIIIGNFEYTSIKTMEKLDEKFRGNKNEKNI